MSASYKVRARIAAMQAEAADKSILSATRTLNEVAKSPMRTS